MVAEIAGGTPAGLGDAAAAQLALADAAFAKRNFRAAMTAIFGVQKMLFDRRLHYDRLHSPLADDPTAYLAPWRASTAVRALSAPRGRSAPAAPLPTDRPVRLLIATYGNHGFINPIRAHYEAKPGVEVRFLDPTGDLDHIALMSQGPMMESLLAGATRAYRKRAPSGSRRRSSGPTWSSSTGGAALSVLFSMVDPGPTRVIVRLHSFEAFRAVAAPWSTSPRVDDMIFVSDIFRDLVAEVVPEWPPALACTCWPTPPRSPRSAATSRPRRASTSAWSASRRSPRTRAGPFDVLRELRAGDDRYRLHF